MDKNLADKKSVRHRPAGLWLVVLLLGSSAVFGFARFSQSIIQWNYLKSLLPISPLYFALSGAFWGIMSLAAAFLVWVGWRRSAQCLPWFFGLGSIHFWFERLVLQVNPTGSANWLFALCLNLALFGWIIWLFNKPQYHKYFGI